MSMDCSPRGKRAWAACSGRFRNVSEMQENLLQYSNIDIYALYLQMSLWTVCATSPKWVTGKDQAAAGDLLKLAAI